MRIARVDFSKRTSNRVLLVGVLAILLAAPVWAQSDSSAGDDDAALRGYYSANGLLNRGLYELAVAEYRSFLSQYGRHEKADVARYGLGVSLFRLKKFDEAVSELKTLRSREEFSYAAEVRTIIGQSHLAKGRFKQAAKSFEVVAKGDAKHALADDAASGWVESLYQAGGHDEALAACKLFSSRYSDSPLAQRTTFFCGLSEMAKSDYVAAAKRFELMLDDQSDGPLSDRATLLLSQCHHHNNSIAAAIRGYRKVLKKGADEFVPDALLGLGMLLRQRGDGNEAGKMLDRLLKRFPKSSLALSARFHLGLTRLDDEKYNRAFDAFQFVAKHESDLQDDAAYWMGKCRLRQERFHDAAVILGRAAEAFSNSELIAQIRYDRAVALLKAEELEQAVEALDEFRSRFHEHEMSDDALHLLAVTQHRRENYEQSIAHCSAFLSEYKQHALTPAISFLLAENEFLSGEYKDAAEAYAQYLTAHPDDESVKKAQFRRGMALYRIEEYVESADALSIVAEFADEDEVFRASLLALGDMAFQRSEWKIAEQYLQRYTGFASDMPSADDAILKLGLAHQRQQHFDEAINAYDVLIRRFDESPHRIQAFFEKGQALVALNRTDDAAKWFERVLKEGGDSSFAPYASNHLGAIAMKSGDFSKAAAQFERATSGETEGDLAADAIFRKAQALMAADDFAAAQETFERLTKRFPDSSHALSATAQAAIAMARQDHHEAALAAIGNVEGRLSSDEHAKLRSSLAYEKAWCLRALERNDDAGEAYRQLLDDRCSDELRAHALLDLAGIELEAKKFEPAQKLLRQLRELLATDGLSLPEEVGEQGIYRLGVCAYELGTLDEAASLFDEFIEAYPQSTLVASSSFFAGESLFQLGQHGKAAKHLKRVREQYPSDPVHAPSLLRLGECLSVLQRWARGEEVFAEFLSRYSDHAQWYQAQYGLGWARENQKRYDDAIRSYEKIVARHKGETAARAQFQIGECLFAKGSLEEAVRELLKVDILYAYPQWSAAALFEAGRCFEKLSKPVEARNHFRLVTEKYKTTRWAQPASERLSVLMGAAIPGR